MEWTSNHDVVLEGLKRNEIKHWNDVPEHCKHDWDILCAAFKSGILDSWHDIPPHMRSDREVMLAGFEKGLIKWSSVPAELEELYRFCCSSLEAWLYNTWWCTFLRCKCFQGCLERAQDNLGWVTNRTEGRCQLCIKCLHFVWLWGPNCIWCIRSISSSSARMRALVGCHQLFFFLYLWLDWGVCTS